MALGVVGKAWFGIALTGDPGHLSERSIVTLSRNGKRLWAASSPGS